MKALRRLLGISVMIAGILGLILSLTGIVSVWVFRPMVAGYLDMTILTLDNSIDTSQMVMDVTGQALGATVSSVDALSTMLGTTATSVEDTQPVLDEVILMMNETVPSTMEAATDSLETAQQAAVVLDSAIKSLESFQAIMSVTPLLSAFVEKPAQAYDPEVPLADSLGELAITLGALPVTFKDMAANLDEADDNLLTIQDNLITMSDSVTLISDSLSEYQMMVGQSKASMENLRSILISIQDNQTTILNWTAIVLSFFFLWLLAAQVVIFSQRWELLQGTAGRIEGGETFEQVKAARASEKSKDEKAES